MKTSLYLSRLLVTAGCAAATLLPLCATAEVRIATVDVARIINEAPDAVAKKKELDALSEEAKKKLEAKKKDVQALKTKLEDQKVSADSKEAEAFRNQLKDLERLHADTKADLEKKYVRINKELTDKVMRSIESYAKANKYDLVIDKSEKYRGPVLYGNASADVTNEILKNLK